MADPTPTPFVDADPAAALAQYERVAQSGLGNDYTADLLAAALRKLVAEQTAPQAQRVDPADLAQLNERLRATQPGDAEPVDTFELVQLVERFRAEARSWRAEAGEMPLFDQAADLLEYLHARLADKPKRAVARGHAPIIDMADSFTGGDPVNDLAIVLMQTWGQKDPHSTVACYPTSYVATFADMARAALAWQAERS